MADTGIGATIAFSVSSYAGNIRVITPDEESIPIFDKTHLGSTTTRKKFAGALRDAGGFTVVVEANLNTMLTAPPPLTGTLETVTITPPGGGTLVGSAVVDTRTVAEMSETEEMMTSEFHCTWTGFTSVATDAAGTTAGPVWTDA